MVEVFDEPRSTSGSQGSVDDFFIKRKAREGFLVVERAGIHGLHEFHDGDRKRGVAGKDGGLNRGSATIKGKEGRVDV